MELEMMVGMEVAEVVVALVELGVAFELDVYEDGEVFGVQVGEFWSDHAELEVEDGQVVSVEYVEWV